MIKSFLRLTRNFSLSRYHKYKITRLPGEQIVVMLQNEATLNELFEHIRYNFKNNENGLVASSAFTSELVQFPVNEELLKASEQIQDQPFLPYFMANDLYIYETVKDKAHLIYGLECLELNLTNNRHLPQSIQNGIIQLNHDWQSAHTVAQALQMPKRVQADPAELQKEKEEFENALAKSVGTLQMLSDLQMERPIDDFVKKASLIMGANWVFLYVITFGYYGWDVGEPISYLTAVGADLLALLRIFDLQGRINFEVAYNEGKWMGLLNILAHKRRCQWLHRYMRKQIN